MKKYLLLQILIIVGCLFFSLPTQAAWNVWVDHSIKKIKQNGRDSYDKQVHSGKQALTVSMAKNEFESFQVFVYASGENLSNVDVTVDPIKNGSNIISDVYLYKEWYINCSKHSRPDYTTGRYPTALLPKVDRYYKEERNTFPFDVNNGNVQGVWVDVGTAVSTKAGTYHTKVKISVAGKNTIEIPVTILVWDFSLPSTATFDSMIAINNGSISLAHMGTEYKDSVNSKLYPLYVKMMLYHRISTRPVAGAMGVGYDWNSSRKQLSNLKLGQWEGYYKDALDGRLISSGPYAGARPFSSVVPRWGSICITDNDGSISNGDKPTAAIQYLQKWYNYFGSKGWDPAKHLYVTVEDEPKTYTNVSWRGKTVSEVQKVLTQASEANQIDTSVYGNGGMFKNVLINAHNESYLKDFVGLYNPFVGHYAPVDWDKTNPNSPYIFPRANYPQVNKYWAYMSCMSNGCSSGNKDFPNGSMDLSADAPPIFNRIFSFYYQKQGLTGFWHFQSNLFFTDNPYGSLWPARSEGSNGDGHFIYPGVAGEFGGSPHGSSTPNIGGTHDIPVESIRLKLIRDAMEDMEYFKLAKENSGKTAVDNIVDTMFTNTDIAMSYWNLNKNVDDLFVARSNIAALINSGGQQHECNDGMCNSDETCSSCPSDCGVCSAVIRADVNQDNKITATDALLTLKKSVDYDLTRLVEIGWHISATTGDVNCDGEVSATDAMLILKKAVGGYSQGGLKGMGWCEGS